MRTVPSAERVSRQRIGWSLKAQVFQGFASAAEAMVLLSRAWMQKRPRRASGCELIPAKAHGQTAPIQNRNPSATVMARLEALLAPVADGEEFRGALAALSRQMGGSFTWLDDRNASIALTKGPRALPVQVLLEIRPRCQLGVLVGSREGMGSGAPLSTAVLEEMLAGLQASVPAASVRFRSDRDGPVRQAAVA
jgi:hypothetical protein